MRIDYRIWVAGPCGFPLGTYDEHWIAHGTFSGTIEGNPTSASLSYLAQVKAGGDVDGQIVFSDGLEGALSVGGNFGDGVLSYSGWVFESAE
ncbi:MAG: hypothetical protein H7A47_17060 [Verrucomicrobiales bacterium]|nr:hypothetical protein [Verrucomicrobiales bacterium]